MHRGQIGRISQLKPGLIGRDEEHVPAPGSMNPHAAHRTALRPVIVTGSPNELTLDTTDLSPTAIVEMIAAHIEQVRAQL
jgi:hypothetical protein